MRNIYSWNSCSHQDIDYFITLKWFLITHSQLIFPPFTGHYCCNFYHQRLFILWFHINEIKQDLLLCFVSFTQVNVLGIHLHCYMNQYFFPFHYWIVCHCMNIHNCLFIHQQNMWIFSSFWHFWLSCYNISCKFCGYLLHLHIQRWLKYEANYISLDNGSENKSLCGKHELN